MFRNKAFISLIVSIFAIFSTASFLISQEADSSSEPITIIANYKEKIKEFVFATGSVEIHYKDIKLFADRAELNTETKDVYAEGNVLVQMPEEVVSAEEIRMNLDSLRKPIITTCTQPVPRWKLSSSRAKLKKDDYIDMWNPVFYIKKIPVFYLPYMRYPLKEDRSTGFLMPKLGYSGSKGFSYSQVFYWAMKRNMDATLNFDYYSARGLGGGLEYRYLFTRSIGGQLNLYYFNFKDDPEEESSSDAYLFRLKHNQPLPLKFSLVADIDYSSSFDFLREFDNDFKRAVVSNRRSQLYLTRAWSYFNLNARVSRFETYYKETDRSIIRHELPEVRFSSYKIKIFSPLYLSFTSSFSRWEYGWESEYEKGTQKRSQSLAFKPQITFPFKAIPWLTLNSEFSSNINYYFQSYAPNTQDIVDEPLFSSNYALNAEFTGPVFYKIYYGAEGKAKLKHIIEPTFTYRYESPVYSSERIIRPWIFYRNHYIRYGITNRFLIKKDKMPKEVFTLGLAQTFYFLPEESPLQVYRVDGEIPEFTDISGYLRFYPARKYSLDVSAAFNPYHNTFSTLRLGANLGSPADSLFLRVNWYKSVNPYYENVWWDRHQISFFGGLKIPELSLEAQAELDFNIQEGEMLYSALALVYNYQCLDFRVELKVFYFREKPETQFLFSFGLGNIGKTIDFLGGMGF